MATSSRILPTDVSGRLGRKLLLWILLGSTVFTVLGTVVQLTFDYRNDREAMLSQLEQIRTSRLSSLTSALWHLDEVQILVQLEGVLEMRDMMYAEVITPEGIRYFRGAQAEEKNLIVRKFPLQYRVLDRIDMIGTLVVAADKSALWRRLLDKSLVIGITQGVQIFLVAILVVFIFYMLVTRHLRRMALYTSGLTIDRLQEPLLLDKSSSRPDEIDIVVRAFNDMRENLLRDIKQREDAEKKLKEAEGYIRNILDSMPSILVSVDVDGRITQWNQQAVLKTGVSVEAAMGRQVTDVFPGAPVSMEQIRAAVNTNLPVKIPKVPRKNEDVVVEYVDVTVYPLMTNDVQGAVIRIDDATERVRLEEMLIQSEKMISVGGLAAGMAHEINNPLAGILQNGQVIRNRISPELPANRKLAEELGTDMELISTYFERRGCLRMMDSIMDSGLRAARIVENMLSFSRKNNLRMAEVDIPALLDRTLELAANDYDLKKQYDFRKIRIEREYEENLPLVHCEESKIQQVFFNLIRNGAQAMGSQDRPPCFILRVMGAGTEVRIEIEDNGPGMSEELRKRVFEPFFTTKRVGEGTGLGLSVSYFLIVENHGGRIDVESSPGKGSVFIIHLPLTPVDKTIGGAS
ncbi:PAS domain S-box-containing protein [Desulfomicrobium macestii]|uniref:histidine kinase n=2 Tax=Desulfomicrobium TaxID=898 RepID=A0A8G2C1P7_DESNO|nr:MULTISPECIES: ATP-binding protein [Desulfomicrobium]MBE1424290.1 PAS domain S-box-containing protein [Desulfomicrobium macestii]SFL53289.1 PAS domain S-box-containing protein [Desulfomicrobium norvegicum]